MINGPRDRYFDEKWASLIELAQTDLSAPDAALEEAVAALKRNDNRGAYDIAVTILERDNENCPALTVCAIALLHLKEEKRARAVSDRLMTLAPENWRTHIIEAWVLVANNQRRDAAAAASRAMHLAPQDPHVYSSAADVTSQIAGKAKLATQAANRAIALDPRLVHPHMTLASLRELQVDWPAAIESYEKALLIDPRHAHALRGLAEVQRRSGRRGAASRTYQQLAEIAPELLDQELAKETPLSVAWLVYHAWTSVLAVIALTTLVVATKPTLPLAAAALTAGVVTALPPLRHWLALGSDPRTMARASTRTSWAARNPDIVVGLKITATLVILLLISVFADSSA